MHPDAQPVAAAGMTQHVADEVGSDLAQAIDVGLDVEQELGDRRIGVAATDDVKSLKQGHPRFHHRGELARKKGDVLFRDLATHLETGFLDLGIDDDGIGFTPTTR